MDQATTIDSILMHRFYDACKDFRIDCNNLLEDYRKTSGHYRNIFDSTGSDRITIYLSDKSRHLLKIIVNYNQYDYGKCIVDIFSEDPTVKEAMEGFKSYRIMVESMTEVRKILHQEKMLAKLKNIE